VNRTSEGMEARQLSVADLYDEYADALERHARRLAHDDHMAEDLVQETMVRAMTHLGLLSGLNPYQRKAWLYRVLRNHYFDLRRTQHRAETVIQQSAKQMARSATTALLPSAADLIESAPARFQAVLEKRFVLGMTSAEIGRAEGIPAATVRSRLHVAIRWLRTHHTEKV